MSENLINSKICKGCHQTKSLNEFLSKNNEMKATYNDLLSHKENAISLQQLPGVIYKSLLVAGGIENSLDDNNIQFTIEQILLLDEDSSNTLSEEKMCKKNVEKIVSLASERDGYQYVYHSKAIQKRQKTITFFYWCNMRIKLDKHSKKIEDASK
ncbi:hypothetical protein C1645_830569 [Glomus cerebriforme]|uniref:Uncharacterized protein n=1 Tax=Glomus cerebriforme TaxID=658196 RepID=A0A397SLS4_9GLOM|nr:hypothetical protein C1645_830569 [Glomus cerebriforme]